MMWALWLVGGLALAVVSAFSIDWTVGRLSLISARSWALMVVAGGAVARIALAALLLAFALRQGVVDGLLAFAGLWLGRWAGIALLSWRGRVTVRAHGV